jgi:hypothetical protein
MRPFTVTFGDLVPIEALCGSGIGATDEARVADALRRRLATIAANGRVSPSIGLLCGRVVVSVGYRARLALRTEPVTSSTAAAAAASCRDTWASLSASQRLQTGFGA